MKRITEKSFSTYQKKEATYYLQSFIKNIFAKPLKNKNDLLPLLATYTHDNTCGELILKQNIMKGAFPRVTWPKQDIIKISGLSNRITTNYPKEQADVRFLLELITANRLLDNDSKQNFIKKITFNSEKPEKASILVSRGNQYKDVNFDVQINQGSAFNVSADIKIGNNGTSDFFSGSLSPLPLKDDFQPYTVVNNQITLSFIQASRKKHLISLTSNIRNELFQQYSQEIENLMTLPLDPIILNNLIQKQLFGCISLNVLHKQPSFFAPYKISTNSVLHERFYEKLEPYIKPSIFDNKTNFNNFMINALRIYNESVSEISKNITNSCWEGTGFENIADDIFR